jgi:predicted metal-dependent hydrolase
MCAVQLWLPWDVVPAPPAGPRHLLIDGDAVTIHVVRHRRARRYVVRVAPDGTVRLTVPRGSSIAGGLRFAATQTRWIARERGRQIARQAPWQDGTQVWYRGERITIQCYGRRVVCGDVTASLTRDADVRSTLERRLREVATAELPDRCLALADACALTVARVSVRNQRSRWGACSSRGVITLNWRLVQMPPRVSDYVILHELMHLRQPNHSRRFWRQVDNVCSWWREAERWLRANGKDIL